MKLFAKRRAPLAKYPPVLVSKSPTTNPIREYREYLDMVDSVLTTLQWTQAEYIRRPVRNFTAGVARVPAAFGIPNQFPRPLSVEAELCVTYAEIGAASQP